MYHKLSNHQSECQIGKYQITKISPSVNLPPRHPGPPLSLPATPQVGDSSQQTFKLMLSQEERRGGLCLQLPLGRPPPSPLPAMPSPSLPRPLPHPAGFNMGGSLPSHSVGGGSLPSHPLAGGGSLGTPGRTMRDYDETFKEMKKENFNLKLRIFFLEVSFAGKQKLLRVGRLIVNLTFSSTQT